jgi:hypothetical protein
VGDSDSFRAAFHRLTYTRRAERLDNKRSLDFWVDFIIGGGPGHYVGRYVVGDRPGWPYDAYSWQASTTRVKCVASGSQTRP